jgi:ATP-binding cassette subfamily B protein
MSVIQLFNRQATEQGEFTRLNAAYRDANLPVISWDASLYAAVETLSSVAVGLIVWYGGGEIVRGALTFGALVAFIQYIEKFFGPIRDLSAKYSVMQGAMAALERLFHLLDAETSPSPQPSPTRGEGASIDVPPPLMGGGEGEGDGLKVCRHLFTPTPTLPHQGGGSMVGCRISNILLSRATATPPT